MQNYFPILSSCYPPHHWVIVINRMSCRFCLVTLGTITPNNLMQIFANLYVANVKSILWTGKCPVLLSWQHNPKPLQTTSRWRKVCSSGYHHFRLNFRVCGWAQQARRRSDTGRCSINIECSTDTVPQFLYLDGAQSGRSASFPPN